MVKLTNCIFGVLAAGLLVVSGCSKAQKPPPAAQYGGVTVDLPKLQLAFSTNENAEVQSQITQVAFGMRYGDYVKALMALDKLVNDPSVNDAQKKVVNEVIEQVKAVANQQQKPAQ